MRLRIDFIMKSMFLRKTKKIEEIFKTFFLSLGLHGKNYMVMNYPGYMKIEIKPLGRIVFRTAARRFSPTRI